MFAPDLADTVSGMDPKALIGCPCEPGTSGSFPERADHGPGRQVLSASPQLHRIAAVPVTVLGALADRVAGSAWSASELHPSARLCAAAHA